MVERVFYESSQWLSMFGKRSHNHTYLHSPSWTLIRYNQWLWNHQTIAISKQGLFPIYGLIVCGDGSCVQSMITTHELGPWTIHHLSRLLPSCWPLVLHIFHIIIVRLFLLFCDMVKKITLGWKVGGNAFLYVVMHALRDEFSQTNVMLQYTLLAAILRAVCSVIQMS